MIFVEGQAISEIDSLVWLEGINKFLANSLADIFQYEPSLNAYGQSEGGNIRGLVSVIKASSDNKIDANGDETLGGNSDDITAYVKLIGDISQNQSVSLSYENGVQKKGASWIGRI